jgi:hypothetical protein
VARVGWPPLRVNVSRISTQFLKPFEVVVAWRAQALQRTEPEGMLVAFVRNNVVSNLRCCDLSARQAFRAQRMLAYLRLGAVAPPLLAVPRKLLARISAHHACLLEKQKRRPVRAASWGRLVLRSTSEFNRHSFALKNSRA